MLTRILCKCWPYMNKRARVEVQTILVNNATCSVSAASARPAFVLLHWLENVIDQIQTRTSALPLIHDPRPSHERWSLDLRNVCISDDIVGSEWSCFRELHKDASSTDTDFWANILELVGYLIDLHSDKSANPESQDGNNGQGVMLSSKRAVTEEEMNFAWAEHEFSVARSHGGLAQAK